MGILSWIIVGALAGWIGSKVMNTNQSMGFIANVIVGIVGASIGGFVMNNFFGKAGAYGLNIYSVLVALLGSIIFLALLKIISKG